MLDSLGRSQPAPYTDMIMRATVVPALAALAVIQVLDLPGTLGPEPLVGIGYFGSSLSRSWLAERVEALIILLAAGWARHARVRTTSWGAKNRSAGSRAPEYSGSR